MNAALSLIYSIEFVNKTHFEGEKEGFDKYLINLLKTKLQREYNNIMSFRTSDKKGFVANKCSGSKSCPKEKLDEYQTALTLSTLVDMKGVAPDIV